MNVEQRLHHAAHEIREIQVDVPAFVAPSSTGGAMRRTVPILVMSMVLFLGFAAFANRSDGVTSVAAESSSVADEQVVVPSASVAAATASVTAQLTPREEVAMIASLALGPDGSSALPPDSRVPSGVS